MKKALMALAISPFILPDLPAITTGSTPRCRFGFPYPLIQRKADSVAYAAAESIDSLCRKPVNIILYQDLDRRPDGRSFIWEAWAQVIGPDTLYTHTVIYPL